MANKHVQPGDEILFNYGDFRNTKLHLLDQSIIESVEKRYGYIIDRSPVINLAETTQTSEVDSEVPKVKKLTEPRTKKTYRTKQAEKERRERKELTVRELRHKDRLEDTRKSSTPTIHRMGNETFYFGDPTLGSYEVLEQDQNSFSIWKQCYTTNLCLPCSKTIRCVSTPPPRHP